MIVVALAVFLLLRLSPGDPAAIIAGDYATADQVAKICRILTELSLEIASPDEARQMLGLKGAAKTDIPDLSAAGAA